MDEVDASVVKSLLEDQKCSRQQVLGYIKQMYPHIASSISLRTLDRFCKEHGISRCPPTNTEAVGQAVKEACRWVSNISLKCALYLVTVRIRLISYST